MAARSRRLGVGWYENLKNVNFLKKITYKYKKKITPT